jgi:hypothetical protein
VLCQVQTQVDPIVFSASEGTAELELGQATQQRTKPTKTKPKASTIIHAFEAGALPADAVKVTRGRAQHLVSEARSASRPQQGAWEDRPACKVTPAILKHTIKAISAAELLTDPFRCEVFSTANCLHMICSGAK